MEIIQLPALANLRTYLMVNFHHSWEPVTEEGSHFRGLIS